jgi:Tol biopolymer transport system component
VSVDGKADSVVATVEAPSWRPSVEQWAIIQRGSVRSNAKVRITGVHADAPSKALSGGAVDIATSSDAVGDPIFYRDVGLPFVEAVKDPSKIRWRFGPVTSAAEPPVVLENLPVCGNCHSFSKDGKTFGMDVDYANDKGSYAVLDVERHMTLAPRNIITWADYRKEDKQLTFGLLSQVSPDGRYAVSTVKDRSVFVPMPDLAYSQLFFPIRGILVTYTRETGTFASLPGADDPRYVQSNPNWSPDGKDIVFARSEAYKLRSTDTGAVILTAAQCREFLQDGKKFLFDLYRVPFNDGKGGTAEPLRGASQNGKSNYFARYSPDGKWIVFCKAGSFMLLQPDSRLFIMPAAGGEAREMRCNRSGMNSWHSWSSNSRWLVFACKVGSPFTRLCLAHVDQDGNDAPPVILDNFTSPTRAANIPEFVHASPDAIDRIEERFIETLSSNRLGLDYRNMLGFLGQNLAEEGKFAEAEKSLKELVGLSPKNAMARFNFGVVLTHLNKVAQARDQFDAVVALQPKNPRPYFMLGVLAAKEGKTDEAVALARKALEQDPNFGDAKDLLRQLHP